jgi:nicotianamine synthase
VITQLVDQLNRTDLWPGPQVDTLFNDLVAFATSAGRDHPTLMDPDRLALIHRICATGEANLEDYWSGEILNRSERLTDFPYLHNYQALARAEYQALTSWVSGPLRHIVFVGCGPLPLTALELCAIDPQLRITCLDIDPTAANRAREVMNVLAAPQHRVQVACADAFDHDHTDADAVLIAALVGDTSSEKLHLLEQIASTLSPHVLLAARSVPDDGRQLLYPRIDPTIAATTVTVISEWDPPPGVINSLLLLKARSGPRRS